MKALPETPLRRRRLELELSQQQVVELAQTHLHGVTLLQTAYSNYEMWRRIPNVFIALAIGCALDIPADEIHRYFGRL
jgi:hypothetical protein